MNSKISATTAQEILDNLVNKDVYLSCGYGGVIFLEIGNIFDHCYEYEKGKKTTRKYGDYRLFCDENWSFSNGKDIQIDRWTSSSSKTDSIFESLGVHKLEKIEVIKNFKKTIFHISGGYTFAVIKDDSIDTFSITLIPEKKKLTVFGNGDIEFKNYEEDKSYLKKSKPRPKRTETVSIERNFLRNQIPDLLPISFKKTNEFIQPILNQQIQAIEINSGTRFILCLGDDYRKLLSKEDQESWHNPIYKWSLTIDEAWVLKKENEVVIDVLQESFHFEEKLVSILKNKQILEINFDKKGAETQIIFNDKYTLTVLETNRYSKWDLHDFFTGFSVASYRDEGLVYRISSPIHLSNKYQTGDVHLDAILYELKFYRDYFTKK